MLDHPEIWAERAATFLGILSVYLLAKGDGRGWGLGVLWALLTAYVYWVGEIYGSFALQGMFLVLQLGGLWRWRQGQQKDLRQASRRMTRRELGLAVIFTGLGWPLLWHLLNFSGGEWVLLDSFLTSGSLVAQATMVLGLAEAWLIWLVVDLFYIVLSALSGMHAFVLLYAVFTGLALQGWREWTRDRCH